MPAPSDLALFFNYMRLSGERFFFDRASLCEQIGLPLEAVAKLAQQVSR